MEMFEPRQVDLVAETEGRTISGLILPFGKTGRTSRGEVSVDPGAVKWGSDLRRIKLLDGHRAADGTAVSVGFLQSIEETPEGLRATFKVGTSPTAQTALANAAEGVVDALSVELDGLQFSPDGKRITAAVLSAVALVPIPAFNDARISEVIAQDAPGASGANHPEEDAMSEDTTNQVAPEVTAAQAAPEEVVKASAAAPVGLGPVVVKKETLSLNRVCDILQARLHTGSVATDLQAAFADITRTANPLVSPDGWVGELWSGVAYQRQVVPLLTQRALTSWKVTGWKWTDKPTVAPYTGDKAAVPSDTTATTSVSVSAQRLAGGHDIDRKFIDFNDSEFLESYFRAMAESYAQQSDLIAINAVIAGATDILAPASSTLLKQVAFGANYIRTNARTRPSFVLVNANDYVNLIDIASLDVPAFLALLGVDPSAFIPMNEVPAGSVIVGAQPSMTFYELGGSPIRVQAEHLTNGGRDAAVFGYVATLLHDAKGLVSVTNTP